MIDDIRKYEYVCLRYLEYKLQCYTAYHFISFFIANGYVFSDEIINPGIKLKEKILSNFENNGNYIIVKRQTY